MVGDTTVAAQLRAMPGLRFFSCVGCACVVVKVLKFLEGSDSVKQHPPVCKIVIFDYRNCRNTVATATSHNTVEFLTEKNSQIQPDFGIRLLSMHVGEN